MPKTGPRQARVEPVYEAEDMNLPVIGWNVIDETDPQSEVVISEHETEVEALKAAEEYEQREE